MKSWPSLLAVALSVCIAGCGASKESTEKQLDEMRLTILKLKAEHAALTERLDAVERARVVEAKARPASAGPAVTAVSERGPALAVVKVAPVPDLEEDDPVARTVIRANGRAITVDEKQRSLGPDRDFDLAMTLFKDHKTERALEAFSTFLTRYPESPHAEAITFARAEAYAGKGDHRRAIEQFETVVSKWPGGAKAPDALLREAQSYAWLGDKSDSDETKKRLASAYPGSDAAKKLGAKTGAKP